MSDNNTAQTYLAFFDMCETQQEWDDLLELAYEDAVGGGHSVYGNALWLMFKDGTDTDIPHFGLKLRPMHG